MTRREFAAYQKAHACEALSWLANDCIKRYLAAARLVGLQGAIADRIAEARCKGGQDLTPLLTVWDAVCERYRDERFDAQESLFEAHDAEVRREWSEFVHWKLFPRLLREDEFVRNVLRALRLLPCRDIADVVTALRCHVFEMTLPDDDPPRDFADIEGG